MTKIIMGLALIAFVGVAGCTDADVANWTNIGRPGHVRCYSGGQVIYDGDSIGKSPTENQVDGWRFIERETNDLIRVSGACVVRN